MVRIFLIACLLGPQAACYRPSLVDCVDTCNESHLCPAGLACVGGFCTGGTACMADAHMPDSWLEDARMQLDAAAVDSSPMIDADLTDAAIDASPMIDAMIDGQMIDSNVTDAAIDAAPMIDADLTDAAIDAAPMIDALVDAQMIDAMIDAQIIDAAPMIDAAIDAPPPVDAVVCPPAPNTGVCTTTIPPPMPPYCFTVCTTPVNSMVAATFTSGTWHAAVIIDGPEEAAAIAALGGAGQVWLGLLQNMSTQPTPADGWHWIMMGPGLPFTGWATASGQPDDKDGVENHEEDCGTLTATGWFDENCPNLHPFLIEPF